MTDNLRNLIDEDTPKRVEVPNSWFSLMLWSFAKFGAGMVVAAFAFFWLIRIDERAAAREEKLLEAYTKQVEGQMLIAESMEASADSLEANTETLERLIRVAERAHEKR